MDENDPSSVCFAETRNVGELNVDIFGREA